MWSFFICGWSVRDVKIRHDQGEQGFLADIPQGKVLCEPGARHLCDEKQGGHAALRNHHGKEDRQCRQAFKSEKSDQSVIRSALPFYRKGLRSGVCREGQNALCEVSGRAKGDEASPQASRRMGRKIALVSR